MLALKEVKPEEGEVKPEEGEATPEEAPEAVEEPKPAAPETEEVVQHYLGGPRAEELWKMLSPLMALRKLDSANAKDTDFGMDDPHATMEVTRKSGTLAMTLGEKTFGGRQRYLKVEEDYFLMNRDAFSNLEAPLRLMERRLFPLDAPKIDQVEVTQDEVSKTFIHQNKDDRSKEFWASSDNPDKSDQIAEPWLTQLFRMIAESYVTETDANLTPVMTYTVTERRDSYTVEFLKTDEGEYWARSKFNKGLVRLDQEQAEDIINDLAAVLAPPAEEGEAPQPE